MEHSLVWKQNNQSLKKPFPLSICIWFLTFSSTYHYHWKVKLRIYFTLQFFWMFDQCGLSCYNKIHFCYSDTTQEKKTQFQNKLNTWVCKKKKVQIFIYKPTPIEKSSQGQSCHQVIQKFPKKKSENWSFFIMVIQFVEFSRGSTKFERCLPKNQHTHRKLLNFEDWCSVELSKIWQHFINKVI